MKLFGLILAKSAEAKRKNILPQAQDCSERKSRDNLAKADKPHRILDVFIKALISLAVVLSTTYGWRPARSFVPSSSGPEEETAHNLERTVAYLAGVIGDRNYLAYENLQNAAAYLTESFRALGYQTDDLSYTIQGREFKNVVAQFPGAPVSNSVIVIGAHYDTCFNPGADDNASGVAALLELARLLKDASLKKQIKFIAFVNEEPPFFTTEEMGSRIYARIAKKMGEQIDAAVILEMLGFYSERRFSQKYLPLLGPFYPNRANFIAVVGDFPSRRLVAKAVVGFRKGSVFPIESLVAPAWVPGIYFSDHWSFWQEGYSAVMVTDTAYLRSPHYHASTDLPETLDYRRMAAVVHGLKGSIIHLANQ